MFKRPFFLLYVVHMTFHAGAADIVPFYGEAYLRRNVKETACEKADNCSLANCTDCPVIYLETDKYKATCKLELFYHGGMTTGVIIVSLLMFIPNPNMVRHRFVFHIGLEFINVVVLFLVPTCTTHAAYNAMTLISGFFHGGWMVAFWTVLVDVFARQAVAAVAFMLSMEGISSLVIPMLLAYWMSTRSSGQDSNSVDYVVVWMGGGTAQAISLIILISMAFVLYREPKTGEEGPA